MRKIADLPDTKAPWGDAWCQDPQHKPPGHIVLEPGVYEHICPRCGGKNVFRVPGRPPLTHVAIRFRDQVWSLPKPFRHHHVFAQIRQLAQTALSDVSGDNQGFLDESGRYLTREQALVSAEVNDQIKNGKIIGGVLTSEDLW